VPWRGIGGSAGSKRKWPFLGIDMTAVLAFRRAFKRTASARSNYSVRSGNDGKQKAGEQGREPADNNVLPAAP
jgi:hypothetical protein